MRVQVDELLAWIRGQRSAREGVRATCRHSMPRTVQLDSPIVRYSGHEEGWEQTMRERRHSQLMGTRCWPTGGPTSMDTTVGKMEQGRRRHCSGKLSQSGPQAGEHCCGPDRCTRLTNVADEVVGTVRLPSNDTQGLGHHETVLWREDNKLVSTLCSWTGAESLAQQASPAHSHRWVLGPMSKENEKRILGVGAGTWKGHGSRHVGHTPQTAKFYMTQWGGKADTGGKSEALRQVRRSRGDQRGDRDSSGV